MNTAPMPIDIAAQYEGTFPGSDTDDLGNAYEQAASSFWKPELPKLCDFGLDTPPAVAWYRRVPFKAFVIAGAVIGFAIGIYGTYF